MTTSGVLTFAPGRTAQAVTLAVLADAEAEPAETLTLTLGGPVNAALGAPATATLTIAAEAGYALYLPLISGPPAAAAQGQRGRSLSR